MRMPIEPAKAAASDDLPVYRIPGHIRVILFDAVGTLMYPKPSVADAYCQVISRISEARLDPETVRSEVRSALTARSTAPDLSTSEDEEQQFWYRLIRKLCPDIRFVDQCFQELFEHFASPQNWRCFPDAAEIVDALSVPGRIVAIGSNFDSRLHPVCDGLAPLAHAPLRVISSEIGWRKPAREFFEAVSQMTRCPLETILMVGDDLTNDIEGAVAAGCPAVWIDRSSQQSNAEERTSVSRITSLTQLTTQ